jgi:hypothetical protein
MCEWTYTGACERFPPNASLERRVQEGYLIDAVEVRAL